MCGAEAIFYLVTEADNTIRESEEVLNGGTSSPSIVNVQEMVRCKQTWHRGRQHNQREYIYARVCVWGWALDGAEAMCVCVGALEGAEAIF